MTISTFSPSVRTAVPFRPRAAAPVRSGRKCGCVSPFAQFARQLAERDPHLARDRPAATSGGRPRFPRAFERAQRHHAAARRDLQAHVAFANTSASTPPDFPGGLGGCKRGNARAQNSPASTWPPPKPVPARRVACSESPASSTNSCRRPARCANWKFAARRVRMKTFFRLQLQQAGASASGSGGSSVCAVKTHFSGTPTTQSRSRTPAASSWLRISRPTSSGAAVSGSRVSGAEKLCSFCSAPFVRRSTTPSSRPPSSARPSTRRQFFRLRNLNFKSDFIACRSSRPNLPAPCRPAPSRAGSSPGDIKFSACRR